MPLLRRRPVAARFRAPCPTWPPLARGRARRRGRFRAGIKFCMRPRSAAAADRARPGVCRAWRQATHTPPGRRPRKATAAWSGRSASTRPRARAWADARIECGQGAGDLVETEAHGFAALGDFQEEDRVGGRATVGENAPTSMPLGECRRSGTCHEKGLVNHLEANGLPSVGAMAVRAGGGATSPLAMAGARPRHLLRNPRVQAQSGLAGTRGEACVTARRCRSPRLPCPWRSADWCTCRCPFARWRSWSGCRRP